MSESDLGFELTRAEAEEGLYDPESLDDRPEKTWRIVLLFGFGTLQSGLDHDDDQNGAADRDCVLEKGDRKILPSSGSYQPSPKLVATERPRYSAKHARQEAANQSLACRAES